MRNTYSQIFRTAEYPSQQESIGAAGTWPLKIRAINFTRLSQCAIVMS